MSLMSTINRICLRVEYLLNTRVVKRLLGPTMLLNVELSNACAVSVNYTRSNSRNSKTKNLWLLEILQMGSMRARTKIRTCLLYIRNLRIRLIDIPRLIRTMEDGFQEKMWGHWEGYVGEEGRRKIKDQLKRANMYDLSLKLHCDCMLISSS